MATGNTEAAITAVRETFTSFLTGPSIGVIPLEARLVSQAHEEAKQASCPYVLLTTIEHQRKQGNNFLRRAAGGAVEAGAWQVMGSATSTGEDVLTPLVEQASEAIAAVIAKGGK